MSSWTGCTSTSDANACNRCTNMSFETAPGIGRPVGIEQRKEEQPDQEAADVRLPGNARVHDAERRSGYAEEQVGREPKPYKQRRPPISDEVRKALPRPKVRMIKAVPLGRGGKHEAGRRGPHGRHGGRRGA